MKNYTIVIEPPENEEAPLWSAHCEELNFTTENKTPEESLGSLFYAINMIEKDAKKISIKKPITFKVPSFS